MQISMWVPYDKKRQKRLVKFVLRSQLISIRVAGGGMVVLGLLFLAQDISTVLAYFLMLVGVFWAVAVPPLTVRQTIDNQSALAKDGCQLTLDDEGVTTAHPLIESRVRWGALSHVVETPEVWYLVLSKMSAVAVAKTLMTEEQRATFAEFVRGFRPVAK
ncbi:YcxB family protein [Nocardia sp. NPDC050175]|uniref:YcxB family protein n=1 Tax=Nocardia sp. NPDC050175 TaxID=3364317 RepID=UPI0037B50779